MGSFDQVCAVSGLPIRWGDQCLAIALKPNKYGSLPRHGSYANNYDAWWPIQIPFLGEYDGYGRLNNISPSAAGEALSKELNFDSSEDFISYCERDPETNSYSGYGLMFIHLSMYIYVLNKVEADVSKNIFKFEQATANINLNRKTYENPEIDEAFLRFELLNVIKDHLLIDSLFLSLYPDNFLEKYIQKPDGYVRQILEVKWLMSFMNTVGKLITPLSTPSQGESLDTFIELNNKSTKFANRLKVKYDE